MLKVPCSPSVNARGPAAIRPLADEMARMGLTRGTRFVVSTSARRPVEPVLAETFGLRGIRFGFVAFRGQCCVPEIVRCEEIAERAGVGSIVGLGGGKALDTARSVANEPGIPVVCCPTGAASDAPCRAPSVVCTPDGVVEKCLYYRRNPDLVLVDTAIVARAPVPYLVAGMGDALATGFEADTAHRTFRRHVVGGGITLAAMAIARLC